MLLFFFPNAVLMVLEYIKQKYRKGTLTGGLSFQTVMRQMQAHLPSARRAPSRNPPSVAFL